MATKEHTWAIVRQPPSTAFMGLTTDEHKRLGIPDHKATLLQHDAYVAALRKVVDKVIVLAPEEEHPDSHYVQDTAAVFGEVAVLANMNDARKGDVLTIEKTLKDMGKMMVRLQDDRKIEFGDVVPLGDKRLLVGVSGRTSLEGAITFDNMIRGMGFDIKIDIVPFSGVLHLGTGLSAINSETLIRDPHLKTDFSLRKVGNVIDVHPDESYAANFRGVKGKIIMAEGYPRTLDLVSKYTSDIQTVKMTQFQMMNGSITCLSNMDIMMPI